MDFDESLPLEPTINDLPNEIIYMIFDAIDRASLLSCALVCHKWLDLINSSSRLLVQTPLTVDRNCHFDFIQSWPTLMRIHKKVTIHRIDFSVVSPNLIAVCSTADELALNDVMFENYSTLLKILRSCGNLRYLELDTPTVKESKMLLTPPPDDSDCWYTIDEVDLILRDDEDVRWEVLKLFQEVPMNIRRLMLYLDLELEPQQINEMFDYIAQYYQQSLKKLKISRWNTNGCDVAPLVLKHLNQMDNLHLQLFSIEEAVDNTCFTKFIQRQQSLQVLEMGNFSEGHWSQIVTLPNLEELFLKIRYTMKLVPINANISKLTKLKKITLALHDPHIDDIEFSFLSQLPDLKHLSLDDKQENRPVLRLTHIGPHPLKSLKELYFGHLTIEYETFQTIFRFMPNLEVFVLFNIFGTDRNELLGKRTANDVSISNLQKLRFLALDSYGVNDEVLSVVKFPHLVHLEFYGFLVTYTDVGLASLYKNCPLLKEVNTNDLYK